MSDARCPAKSADLPLKKRAMKKQFSPPCSRLRGENGVGGRGDEGEEMREQQQGGEETKKRQMGIAVNNRLLRGEDGEAFDNIMQKQLEIVEGTEQFYRRMDESLREGRVEPYFVKEQWDLYAWREKFFNDNFPPGSLTSGYDTIFSNLFLVHIINCFQGSWFSEPGAREVDVIPAQVTRNFKEIMQLASSAEERAENEQHYFASDIDGSARAVSRFSRSTIKSALEEEEESLKVWLERESSLTFSQLAHCVVEFHQDGLSLVFGCEEKKECDKLREALKQGHLEEVGEDAKVRASEGWYRLSDTPPKFLTGEGKKIFNDLKAIFNKERKPKLEKKDNIKKKVKL